MRHCFLANNVQRTARGGRQELNGDLAWRGVCELARPPKTASPHPVHARSRRPTVSYSATDVVALRSENGDFNRKGQVA
jgi:hypothetical protein